MSKRKQSTDDAIETLADRQRPLEGDIVLAVDEEFWNLLAPENEADVRRVLNGEGEK